MQIKYSVVNAHFSICHNRSQQAIQRNADLSAKDKVDGHSIRTRYDRLIGFAD